MTYKQFMQLKAEAIGPVYLIFGEEGYGRQQAIARLREMLLSPGMESLDEDVLDAPDATRITDACDQMPLASLRRLVIVKRSPLFAPDAPAAAAAQADILMRYLQNPSPTTCLIIDCDSADKRRALYKELLKREAAIEFPLLDEPEAAAWAMRACKRLGKTLDLSSANELVFLAGRSLAGLGGEIEKLCAYVGDTPAVTRADIHATVSRTSEAKVFQMLDALTAGKEAEVHAMLAKLLEGGEAPAKILALIVGQLRQLAAIRELSNAGIAADGIEKALSLQRFVVQRGLTTVRRWTPDFAALAFARALDADHAFKSGALREREALDRLILHLCRKAVGPDWLTEHLARAD